MDELKIQRDMLALLAVYIPQGVVAGKIVKSFTEFYPITIEETEQATEPAKKRKPTVFSDEDIEKLIGKKDK